MKLFLSAKSISEDQKQDFIDLVGKKSSDIKFALIQNAADPYESEARSFVDEAEAQLNSLGLNINKIDLRNYQKDITGLYEKLKEFDVMWVGGGNIYYLRWIMKESGFDQIIRKLLNEGAIYGGGSAGAIVSGQVLDKYDLIDDPSDSPALINRGLGLTNLAIIPHWDDEVYQRILLQIKSYYDNTNYEVITLTDEQAIVINGDKIMMSPRK